jgi:hypothetical protein
LELTEDLLTASYHRYSLFGFLLGSTITGAASYYYVLDDYRMSNELLSNDVIKLQHSIARIEAYVKVLEDKIGQKK